MPKVSKQHEEARREQILEAAARCFARGGFATTSVPDIAAEAHLAVGSLYRYFSSKEDLFLAVIAERVAVYNEAVFTELARPGEPVRRLRMALRRLERLLATQSPDEARLLLELWARAHDVPALREWLREARAHRIQAFRQVIEEAKLSGAIRRDVRTSDATAMLMAVTDGLVVQHSCSPFHPTTGEPLNEASRLLASWQTPIPSRMP